MARRATRASVLDRLLELVRRAHTSFPRARPDIRLALRRLVTATYKQWAVAPTGCCEISPTECACTTPVACNNVGTFHSGYRCNPKNGQCETFRARKGRSSKAQSRG